MKPIPATLKHHQHIILIAEDERPLAKVIATTLDGEGLHSIVVHDGAHALALARGLHPDVLISDVMMPEMDGIALCHALKADPVTASIPVVLLTAKTDVADRAAGLAAGAIEYLPKPFSPIELITLVQKIIAGQPITPKSYQPNLAALPTDQLAIYAQELRALYERERAERRALEEAQRRLDDLDRLKAAFLGTITHELLTPFSTFGMALQLVQKAGERYPELKTPLEDLGNTMAQLHRKVKGVVKFAELVNKSHEPQFGLYDLNTVVSWALQPLAVMAQSRMIDFRVLIAPDLPKVYADAELLSEAVFQMVHNAVKFSQAGGKVVTRVFVKDEHVWIEVRDEGAGLTAEQIALLGRPFEVATEALRNGQEGMGIGWALVSYVAEVHNGGTHIESAGPGRGSVFALYLPFPQTEPPNRPA
ncbi:MAG TPA: response regulator [Anaerolineae bacterium]|nr:response regulator [Anaerolineae bacterium]HQK15084.1 response regulator [Anaerolineae bacterium]